ADVAAIMAACTPVPVDVVDPNYGTSKRYVACPLADVLRFGFGTPPDALGSADVFIRAWDGYDKPASVARLAEDGAFLAFGDADLSHGGDLRWAPLGPRGIDPGPLYLVWTKPAQRDRRTYPWPWQIAEFEIVEFQKKYPPVMPTTAPRTLIAARAGGNPPIWGPARIRDIPHRTSGFPEPLPVCRLENRPIAGRPADDSGQATGPDRAGVSLASERRGDGGEPRRRT